MNYNTEVFCSLQVEGIHRWSSCPFEEVAYLRDFHRHLFGIKCYKQVDHPDRDTEFIMLKHKVKRYLEQEYYNDASKCCNFGSMSCEQIAEDLILEFNLSWCEVNEDLENGAIVYA